jgi:hypothetical protein
MIATELSRPLSDYKCKMKRFRVQYLSILQFQIKLTLYLIKHEAKKKYEEMEGYLYILSNSTPDIDVWSDSRPGRFTPQREALSPID